MLFFFVTQYLPHRKPSNLLNNKSEWTDFNSWIFCTYSWVYISWTFTKTSKTWRPNSRKSMRNWFCLQLLSNKWPFEYHYGHKILGDQAERQHWTMSYSVLFLSPPEVPSSEAGTQYLALSIHFPLLERREWREVEASERPALCLYLQLRVRVFEAGSADC